MFCKFVSSSSWDPTETIPYDSWSKLETVLQRVATCAPKKLFSKKCTPQKLFSRCHFGWPRKMFSKSWCRSSSCSLRLSCSEHFQIIWRFFCFRPPSKKRCFHTQGFTCQLFGHRVESHALTCLSKQKNLNAWSLWVDTFKHTHLWVRLSFFPIFFALHRQCHAEWFGSCESKPFYSTISVNQTIAGTILRIRTTGCMRTQQLSYDIVGYCSDKGGHRFQPLHRFILREVLARKRVMFMLRVMTYDVSWKLLWKWIGVVQFRVVSHGVCSDKGFLIFAFFLQIVSL